jgi:hypothetical protein
MYIEANIGPDELKLIQIEKTVQSFLSQMADDSQSEV